MLLTEMASELSKQIYCKTKTELSSFSYKLGQMVLTRLKRKRKGARCFFEAFCVELAVF